MLPGGGALPPPAFPTPQRPSSVLTPPLLPPPPPPPSSLPPAGTQTVLAAWRCTACPRARPRAPASLCTAASTTPSAGSTRAPAAPCAPVRRRHRRRCCRRRRRRRAAVREPVQAPGVALVGTSSSRECLSAPRKQPHHASPFPPAPSHPPAGLPEEVSHSKQCLARGYAVLALMSLNREYKWRCFSSSGEASECPPLS